ncbi:MAG: aminotransferase class V-fold PLP-dependent enzyme, partial [Candidatus Korarchaeota archaeon]|nr:aminotransferase class V-fold PLP-dependent enzyme [Candidatus Korarchaeota archaeon]NIU83006.1 aminotransferase class V-fold PLP-dependent enzyme [Candidatus Thorarchaeota archaeon]
IQDIKTIAEICDERGIIFHADATHTFTRVPLDVSELPVDLVTLSPHTIHGPKGIGALYIRKGTPL